MLDFIQFINDNVTALTAEQKAGLLTDFCEQYGYREFVGDGAGGEVPNPISRRDFANSQVRAFLEKSVNAVRKRRAEAAAAWEDLVLE